MSDFTQLLGAVERGEPGAAEQLLPLVYDELRRLAELRLAREKPGQTLQPTALVHEAYLRLVKGAEGARWDGRRHFFAAAAEAIRRILIEAARNKGRQKRGGGLKRVNLESADLVCRVEPDELLRIDEAIDRLAAEDPVAAQLVKLRYYGGLSVEEAAQSAGVARSTAYEHWAYARAWLHCDLYEA